MTDDFKRGLILGLSMQPLYVMTRGNGNPQFVMDGIFGMFTPDTRDIANSRWRNSITGYNDMTLTGGSENGDAVHFEKTQYGSFTCAEPNTVYAVVKTETSTNSSNCVITKKLSSLGSSSKYGFNLLQGQGGRYLYFSGAGLDIAQRNIDCDEYHVYCYTRSEKDVYYYIDGVLIGSVSGCNIGLYSGIMYLNNEYFGSTRLDNPTVCDFIMCAFGSQYHDDATVQKNMAYLMKKYGL